MRQWLEISIARIRLMCGERLAARMLCGFRKLIPEIRGNILVTSALVLPVVVMAAGTALDYALINSKEADLQAAVDAAAISTAREMSLSDANNTRLTASAQAAVAYNLEGVGQGDSVAVSIEIDQHNMTVTVEAELKVEQIFGDLILEVNSVKAVAEAQVVGTVRVCVIGLEEKTAGAIALNQRSMMTGNGCAVFSNSTSVNGLASKTDSVISASVICSAGGAVGGKANFSPEPLTDCPPFEDPLADRPEPRIGACVANELEIEDGRITLSPGTYCGGLEISGDAVVTLRPGIYVMQDGPLKVTDEAELIGQYVGFFFTGNKSTLLFDENTVIDLEAPRDGSMAGILMFESRSAQSNRKHEIFSNNARNLLGTIYFSQGVFYADASAPIADQSAYTVIVANRVELYSGLHLVLNTNYSDTDIPVPAGVRGMNENISLIR